MMVAVPEGINVFLLLFVLAYVMSLCLFAEVRAHHEPKCVHSEATSLPAK